MRFLNTSTLLIDEVADSELDASAIKYAVLSHRWGAADDEVSFADMNSKDFSQKKGFAKLEGFCKKALELGYSYGWDDTCCIKKDGPNEVTESINRMYRWYQGSGICIVYLEDVLGKRMMESEWFGRGWTLQELIGPKAVFFYNREWNLIGKKSELLAELSNKTKIPEDILGHATSPSTCSVAQRMSWAAEKRTTKQEDRAYSLLGIFNVSMPLLYGEREQAFRRLQRAIIQQSKDQSIFAWAMGIEVDQRTATGLLAPSPSSFVKCSDVIITQGFKGFSVMNGEISIHLRTFPHSMETYFAVLNCNARAFPEDRIAILVTRLSSENDFVRVKKETLDGNTLIPQSSLELFKERLIRISLDPTEPPLNRVYGFWLRKIEPPGHTSYQTMILSKKNLSQTDFICLEDKDRGTAGVVHLKSKINSSRAYGEYGGEWFRIRWIKLGFDAEFNPMLFLANDTRQRLSMYFRGWRSILNEELFEQGVTSEADSQARNEIFNDGWINGVPGVPSKRHGWPGGISILKVDRRRGISGCLEALNLGISIQLIPALSPDMMSKESMNESSRHIWVVDITDIRGTDPEQELVKGDKEIRDEDIAEYCCWGSPFASQKTEGLRMIEARHLTKVLVASDLERL